MPPAAITNVPPDAVVVIGPVQPGDNLGLYTTVVDDTIYTDYVVENRYEEDPHIYMHGVTSPNGFNGNHVAFTRTAATTLLWIVDWTAARYNDKPIVPNPVPRTSDNKWVFLWKSREQYMVTPAADGISPMWRVSGTYVYGCVNPSTITENDMVYPRPPWLSDTLDRTTQPGTTLQRNIADNGNL